MLTAKCGHMSMTRDQDKCYACRRTETMYKVELLERGHMLPTLRGNKFDVLRARFRRYYKLTYLLERLETSPMPDMIEAEIQAVCEAELALWFLGARNSIKAMNRL